MIGCWEGDIGDGGDGGGGCGVIVMMGIVG